MNKISNANNHKDWPLPFKSEFIVKTFLKYWNRSKRFCDSLNILTITYSIKTSITFEEVLLVSSFVILSAA